MKVAESNWQHWNGGVFLFDENGKLTESAFYKDGLKEGMIRKF